MTAPSSPLHVDIDPADPTAAASPLHVDIEPVSHEDPATAAAAVKDAPAPITGASEPGYKAPSIFETATHPAEMVDRMHSLLDGLETSVGPSDVMLVRELRNILNHLGATKSS